MAFSGLNKMSDAQQQNPQSPIDYALSMAAVDSCHLLRKWSDSDGKIYPERIREFQDSLKQAFAAVYFGTHPRLEDIDETA